MLMHQFLVTNTIYSLAPFEKEIRKVKENAEHLRARHVEVVIPDTKSDVETFT